MQSIPKQYIFLYMNALVAKFDNHADSVSAWVSRSKTDPHVWEVTLRDDRKGLLELVSALTLKQAVEQARMLVR